MRRESAAERAGSFQPNSTLLRLITQAGTSGASWPGLATGFMTDAAGPPRPAKPPRPPVGGTYFGGVGPSSQLIAARVSSGDFAAGGGVEAVFGFLRHASKLQANIRSLR